MPLRLSPHTIEGLVLTAEETQEFRFEVPVGHATFVYQKADGTRDRNERCFLGRLDGGSYINDGITKTGERIPLIPGTYQVKGWTQMGEFDVIDFEIAVGDEKEIVLRSKS